MPKSTLNAVPTAPPQQLLKLMMLASSNLPIGSYTYSQGVESAIETGLIHDEVSGLAFLQAYQQEVLLNFELPLMASMMLLRVESEKGELVDSLVDSLIDSLADFYGASRDSHEFLLESQQLAQAFCAWLDGVLELAMPQDWIAQGYLPLFARLAHFWQLPIADSLTSYAFAQLENLTLAIVKTLPLGQLAGQRIIWQLGQMLDKPIFQLCQTQPDKVAAALNAIQTQQPTRSDVIGSNLKGIAPEFLQAQQHAQTLLMLITQLELSASVPALAALSCHHEQQYSRLFRS